MDKLNLCLGDPVFVLNHGCGTVRKVLPDGGFVVDVPGHGSQFFSVYGTLGAGQKKILYYHDPILIDPPKSPDVWRTWRALSLTLYDELCRLYRTGVTPPEAPDDPA
jgi:hypothetical protein